MSYYLIPVVKTSRGIPLEYRLIEHRKDMRFTFCRKNQSYEISPLLLFDMAGKFQKDIKIKNNRLILLNGKVACQLWKELKK